MARLPAINMPWYKPTLNRNSVTSAFNHVPHQKLVKGAFIVREGNGNTQYCLSILTDPDNVHLVQAFKHILISQTREGKFHICLRPDEYDFIFGTVEELITFYQSTSIGIHYHDTNCVLTNMFDKELLFQQVGIHDMPMTSNMKAGYYGQIINDQMQNLNINNNRSQDYGKKVKDSQRNTYDQNQQSVSSNSASLKSGQDKAGVIYLPKVLNRSRKRDGYKVIGAVQCKENYDSRNPNQEASMTKGEIFIQVGNKSGPWLPVVPYSAIENKSRYDMEQGLDIQKRYAPEGYVEQIKVEFHS